MNFEDELQKYQPIFNKSVKNWSTKFKESEDEIAIIGKEILWDILQNRPQDKKYFFIQFYQAVLLHVKKRDKLLTIGIVPDEIIVNNKKYVPIISDEIKHRVNLIYNLFPKYKEMFDLLGSGYTIEETAKKLGKSRKCIHKRLNKVKKYIQNSALLKLL